MKDKIFKILNGIRPEIDFRVKEDFFDDGFRDSIEFISFVNQLSAEFGIEIDGMDILPENFSDIEAIVNLLKSYNVKEQ